MSDKNQQFQQMWGFRRNDSDLNSSSDDQSKPSSASEPKLGKQKLATRVSLDENDQQAAQSPQSHHHQQKQKHRRELKLRKQKLATRVSLDENELQATQSPQSHHHQQQHQSLILKRPQSHLGGENNLSLEEPTGEPEKSCKKQKRKPRTRTTNREAFNHESSDAALGHLREYMDSLVEGVKATRGELLKWRTNEMEKSQDDVTSSEPAATREGQQQSGKETHKLKRAKPPKNNANKAMKKAGTRNQKRENDPSEKFSKDGQTSNQTNEKALPQKEIVIAVTDKNLVAKNEKQKRRPGLSTKKQKAAVADQQSEKASAPTSSAALAASAASPTPANYLTLPTVVPLKEVESTDRTLSEDRNERDIGMRNTLNQPSSLSSQMNFAPRSLQVDGIFTQNGLRNVNHYEHHMIPTAGNIQGTANGNGFHFPLLFQGLNGGFSMPNISSQFGQPYLPQESRIPGLNTNGGLPRMPSRNHPFMESYCALNEQTRLSSQSGLMGIPSPDSSLATSMQPR